MGLTSILIHTILVAVVQSLPQGYQNCCNQTPPPPAHQAIEQIDSQAIAPPSKSICSGGGALGAGAQVQCKSQEVSPGKYKFVCEGVDPATIALCSEHILWINGPSGQQQVLDIEVPNYKVEELIKAGFKPGSDGATQINILLKKPEQSYDAQIDELKVGQGAPTVNLQYQPVEKVKVHYPVDKPYSKLQEPLVAPGGGRPQRQVPTPPRIQPPIKKGVLSSVPAAQVYRKEVVNHAFDPRTRWGS